MIIRIPRYLGFSMGGAVISAEVALAVAVITGAPDIPRPRFEGVAERCGLQASTGRRGRCEVRFVTLGDEMPLPTSADFGNVARDFVNG